MPDDRVDRGGPYTLGNDGAVAELGLELSPVPLVGDSGGGYVEPDSVIRDSENVKSRD